jgi:hypothetical protein
MNKGEFGRKMFEREEYGKRIQKTRICKNNGKVFQGRMKDF